MKKKLPHCYNIAAPPDIPFESQATSLHLYRDSPPHGRRATHGISQTSSDTMHKQSLGC